MLSGVLNTNTLYSRHTCNMCGLFHKAHTCYVSLAATLLVRSSSLNHSFSTRGQRDEQFYSVQNTQTLPLRFSTLRYILTHVRIITVFVINSCIRLIFSYVFKFQYIPTLNFVRSSTINISLNTDSLLDKMVYLSKRATCLDCNYVIFRFVSYKTH